MQAKIDGIRKVLGEYAKNKCIKEGSHPTTDNFEVVIWLKKAQRFDNAKTELFSITQGRTFESCDDGHAVRFTFALETQGQADALKLELAHFPDQYESILALFNPIT